MSVNCACAERLPLAHETVTVDVPAEATLFSVSTSCCGFPLLREKLAGFALTPVGMPLRLQVAVELKPLKGLRVTVRL